MAAVYSTFRDVSGVVSPAIARLVLIVSPVAGVFAAGGILLSRLWMLAASCIHGWVCAKRRLRERSGCWFTAVSA